MTGRDDALRPARQVTHPVDGLSLAEAAAEAERLGIPDSATIEYGGNIYGTEHVVLAWYEPL